MNALSCAEKEIRALARKLGVRAHVIRAALDGVSAGDTPPAAMPAKGRLARMATATDMQPRAKVHKEAPARHEGYRRLVAARPCINCGIHNHSQHAHENAGKGKGMKVDDRRAMPLCTVSGKDCHGRFDRYELFTGRAEHIAKGAEWAETTRRDILADGLWPDGLPIFDQKPSP